MTAPLGVRTCPEMGCSRRVHVSPSGIVYARCLMHTLRVLSGAFSNPEPKDSPPGARHEASRAPMSSPRRGVLAPLPAA